MAYDFNQVTDRCGSGSVRWDHAPGGYDDPIPLWVADMDFPAPPPVLDALRGKLEHGVLGYEAPRPGLAEAVVEWVGKQHGWEIAPDWIVWTPGVMPGVSAAICLGAEEGEEVLAFTPVYPPFLSVPERLGRKLLGLPLLEQDGEWEIDFAALEKISPRVLLLCSPHNPVGRVWRREELLRLLDYCKSKCILLCADEIWCDLVLDEGVCHIPFASLGKGAGENTITLMSPSKTFNIAGLGCAFAIIPDRRLRTRFKKAMAARCLHVNALGYIAAEAALREGGGWRQELLDYLRHNREVCRHFCDRVEGLRFLPGEATFLAWLDGSSLPGGSAYDWALERGVVLSDGSGFSAPGWARLNFGSPVSILEAAFKRLSGSGS